MTTYLPKPNPVRAVQWPALNCEMKAGEEALMTVLSWCLKDDRFVVQSDLERWPDRSNPNYLAVEVFDTIDFQFVQVDPGDFIVFDGEDMWVQTEEAFNKDYAPVKETDWEEEVGLMANMLHSKQDFSELPVPDDHEWKKAHLNG